MKSAYINCMMKRMSRMSKMSQQKIPTFSGCDAVFQRNRHGQPQYHPTSTPGSESTTPESKSSSSKNVVPFVLDYDDGYDEYLLRIQRNGGL